MTSHRSAFAAVATLLATIALSAVATAPASAATPTSAHTQSCWQDTDTGRIECFDASIDPLEYIAEATDGPVITDASSTPVAARSSAAATYIITIVYDGTGYSGASFSFSTTVADPCLGRTQTVNSLGSWNDRIDSFRSYNGCTTRLHENNDLGGASYGPYTSSSNVGAFANRASSLFAQ